jgi:A/G-specific adenine glycosylase
VAGSVCISAAVNRILRWASKSGRGFPWRLERDPYAVLIAEKLLQQTAARKVVVEAYEEIVREFGTPEQLAHADINVLAGIIRPLGLSYRARELKLLGQVLIFRHNGKVPDNLRELKALPGVGDYAARAVLSFALNEDVPVVDTNVARFLYRFFGIGGVFPKNPARKKDLIELAATLVPKGRSKVFNLALLDFCAAVCLSKVPRCSVCPLQGICSFGTQTARP